MLGDYPLRPARPRQGRARLILFTSRADAISVGRRALLLVLRQPALGAAPMALRLHEIGDPDTPRAQELRFCFDDPADAPFLELLLLHRTRHAALGPSPLRGQVRLLTGALDRLMCPKPSQRVERVAAPHGLEPSPPLEFERITGGDHFRTFLSMDERIVPSRKRGNVPKSRWFMGDPPGTQHAFLGAASSMQIHFRFPTLVALGAALTLLPVHALAAEGASAPPGNADTLATHIPLRLLLSDSNALATWLYRRNPDLGAARARVDAAEAGVSQARVIPNPTLDVGVSGSASVVDPAKDLGDTVYYSVGLSETIELGKRGPRARAAELRRDAARAETRGILADRLADARDALARTVYLTERGHVIEERLRSARHVAELERVRLEHGDISGIDQDRLELDAAAVERGLADNQVDLQAAVAECSALLLGDCWPIDAAMESVDAAAPTPETFGDVDAMIRARPDVRAALLASSAAKSDAVYYRRHAIPDPTIGLQYARDYYVAAGDQPHRLTATLSLPLPLFDHGQHLARSAESQATEFGMQARSLETRAVSAARSLILRRNILRDKLETLAKLAIPRADSVLKSSEDAYHRGQLSLTDLLLVRREHASLLLDALDTRYELFSVRNTLYRTLGLGLQQMNEPAPN